MFGRRFPAIRIAEEGLFEAQLEGVSEAFDYLLEVATWSGEVIQMSDPYSYGPILGELDMHLVQSRQPLRDLRKARSAPDGN